MQPSTIQIIYNQQTINTVPPVVFTFIRSRYAHPSPVDTVPAFKEQFQRGVPGQMLEHEAS